MALGVAGTALALFATPGFLAFPGIALEDLRLDRGLQDIVPFNPMEDAPLAYRLGFPLAFFAAFAVGVRPRRVGDVLLLLAAGLLALANGTYLPVFGVLVAPLLGASAAAEFPLPESKLATPRGDVLVAIAGVLAAAILVATLVPRERPAAPG